MSWKTTAWNIYSRVMEAIGIVGPYSTPPDGILERFQEERYRECIRTLLESSKPEDKELFQVTVSRTETCQDYGCEQSFGDSEVQTSSTLMLELSGSRTVQQVVSKFLAPSPRNCGLDECKGFVRSEILINTSQWLIVENLNYPYERGQDNKIDGNVCIDVLGKKYSLYMVVSKRNGYVVADWRSNGGPLPSSARCFMNELNKSSSEAYKEIVGMVEIYQDFKKDVQRAKLKADQIQAALSTFDVEQDREELQVQARIVNENDHDRAVGSLNDEQKVLFDMIMEGRMRVGELRHIMYRKFRGHGKCVLPRVTEVDQFNDLVIGLMGTDVISLLATENVTTSSVSTKACPWQRKEYSILHSNLPIIGSIYENLGMQSTAGGLRAELKFALNCRVILRRTIDRVKGLVNGLTGVLEDINVASGQVQKLGVRFDRLPDELIWVTRVTVMYTDNRLRMRSRTQFPLEPAAAVTIHMAQGLTLDNVIMKTSSIFANSQWYVGASRVKTMAGLHLIDFNVTKVQVDQGALTEYERLCSSTLE
ncbi:hypothetical protein GCK72_008196 [Caenorhabditis remanei]|uniref:ATP-dependent DNA helicase n=1 Tax=Caenorhabditis remanei TaxID=31234 RepID=A0A6A5GZ05_CAERE|nr:hypothetical protein GCK72_008196 [Caenorhabditis remanei]KAF1759951.1 hypothetical protein GCK72_008196 [Caenorhabditis remanei]